MASLYNIHVRTGCFCNTGACQRHLGISDEMVRKHLEVGNGGQQDPVVASSATLEAGLMAGVRAGSVDWAHFSEPTLWICEGKGVNKKRKHSTAVAFIFCFEGKNLKAEYGS